MNDDVDMCNDLNEDRMRITLLHHEFLEYCGLISHLELHSLIRHTPSSFLLQDRFLHLSDLAPPSPHPQILHPNQCDHLRYSIPRLKLLALLVPRRWLRLTLLSYRCCFDELIDVYSCPDFIYKSMHTCVCL